MPRKTVFKISLLFFIVWTTHVYAMVFHRITPAEKKEIVQDVRIFLQKNLSMRDVKHIDVIPPSDSAFIALCVQRTVFLPLMGGNADSVTVGVRCIQPASWIVYVRAKVHRIVSVVKTVDAVPANTVLQKKHLTTVKKDSVALPQHTLLSMQNALQLRTSHPLPTQHILTQEDVMRSFVVRANQSVDLVVTGRGFTVRRRATSLGNAFCGQIVHVRLQNGQVMAGVAQEGGTVSMIP